MKTQNIAVVMVLSLLWPILLCAQSTKPADTASAQGDQPLPRDPNNLYGTFDNGFSYIIRKNASPPGKVALNLEVKSGALNENEDQNGLAHFLEHMAFKGSTHFAPTKLIPLLSHLGMTFGADTNAHTNLWETTFKLTMPDNKPQTIDTALTIFSDYASGLGLYPIQIDSERRVILEELRSRKSAGQRLGKEMNAQLFAGTRLAVHDISGDEAQIKTFSQAQFQDYWNAWYRPENMTLVVVGDIDPQAIIAAAKAKLGSFKSRAPERERQKIGIKPFDSARAFVLSDPEEANAQVELLAVGPARPMLKTVSQYRRELVESLSEWIVNRRLSDEIVQGNAPFREASIGSGDMLHEGFTFSASAQGQPQDWKKMIDALITEISRASEFGFSSAELELAKKATLSADEWAIKTEASADSGALVSGISSAVGLDRPILSAKQILDLETQMLAGIDADELHRDFVEDFKSNNYAYILEMPSAMVGNPLPSSQEVLAAATTDWQIKPVATTEQSQGVALLPAEPAPGQIVSQQTDQELGLTTAIFANGVVMHHKFSDYKKDEVLVQITLPGGAIEETAENHGISSAASLILARPATSRLSSVQIRDLMVGKKVGFAGTIGLDTLSLKIAGDPKDVTSGLELANAVLTDGKLEQSALDDWKKSQLQALTKRSMDPRAQIADAQVATVFGSDPRFAFLSADQINHTERAAAEAWFRQIADNAAIEVAVTGDIALHDALKLIGKFIGSLPRRTRDFAALDPLRKLNRSAGPYEKTVHFQSVTPKAIVMAGFIGCDELDPDRRPLLLASTILTERMIQRIRMQEQLVYSIQCQSTAARSIPGTGSIGAGTATDPKNADKLAQTVLDMIKTFAKDGPTEDELATAKKQVANIFVPQMNDPAFWLAQIGEMEYRHRSIDDLKVIPGIYQTFTAAQVHDAMKKCVTDERLIRLEAIPDVAAAAIAPTVVNQD